MDGVTGLMALGLLAAGGAGGAPAVSADADTTVTVTGDSRLEVRIPVGEVRVRAGRAGNVRIGGTSVAVRLLEIRRRGSALHVTLPEEVEDEVEDEYARDGAEPVIEIETPAEMELRFEGEDSDLHVDGLAGSVTAESGDGDVFIRGPAGRVDARSVDGDVEVVGATGPVDAYSPDGDVRISGVSGDVQAESIDGEVILEDLGSRNVQASSTDGEVELTGDLVPGASYQLSSHDGDVLLHLASEPDASFQVTVYDGSFTSSRSLPGVERTREGRATRYRFVLGSGSARVQLETFDGDIHLSLSGADQSAKPARSPTGPFVR